MEEPTVMCTNCERPIPESKSFLHEAYCLRNIIRCPKCNEPVDKSEVDEHDKEMHRMTSCKYCKSEMENKNLSQHEENCTAKPKMCPYCNCEVGGQEYSSHTYQCGSRTKKCIYCNKNILMRDYDDHEPICQVTQSQQNYSENFPKIPEENKNDTPIQSNPYSSLSSKYTSGASKNPYDALSQNLKSKNKDSVEISKASKPEQKVKEHPTNIVKPSTSQKQDNSRHSNSYPTEGKVGSAHQGLTGTTHNPITGSKPVLHNEPSYNKYSNLEHKSYSKAEVAHNDYKYSSPDYIKSNHAGIQAKPDNSNKLKNESTTHSKPSNLQNPNSFQYEKNSYFENQKNETRNISNSSNKYGLPTNTKSDHNDYLNKIQSSHKGDYQTKKAEPLSHTKIDVANYPKKTVVEENVRHGMPIYHQHSTLDRHSNVSGARDKITTSSGLSGQTKIEPKPASHHDLYNKKPSIFDKNELHTRHSKDVSRGLNQDYKSSIGNDFLRKNQEPVKREDESKYTSKLANQPSSYKYSGSNDNKVYRDNQKDYFKKESLPTQKHPSGITSTSSQRTHGIDPRQYTKPTHNIPHENPYSSKQTKNTQRDYGSSSQFEADLSEDQELQKAIQESLNQSKKEVHENKHHHNRNRINVHEEMEAGDLVDDPELQRVIQESLKVSGKQTQGTGLGDTFNDEGFKKALERSKYDK